MLVINGAPTYAEQKRQRAEGLLYSHMTGDERSNVAAYRGVTVAAEQIKNAAQAPAKIDAVLTAMVSEGRPGYLEFYEDVWRKDCKKPCSQIDNQHHLGDSDETEEAVRATIDLIKDRGKPIFWAGIEIQRQKLQQPLQHLVEATASPYMTSILAKSVLPENHEMFRGVYNGKATPEPNKALFQNAGCRIGLGVWNTSKNLGGTSSWSPGMVMANNEGVKVGYHQNSNGEEIGNHYFPNVVLSDFISQLTKGLVNVNFDNYQTQPINSLPVIDKTRTAAITYDSFFSGINGYLREEHTVVVDAGFPLLGAQNLTINKANGFISAAAWLSIGYSVPASLGVKFADRSSRPLVFVGDGAFQETCQAVSEHHYFDTNNVVFVLDNGIYGIEQMLVNPNPFRPDQSTQPNVEKIHYEARPLQNEVYPYNKLNKWQYEKIVQMVGGRGCVVRTDEELQQVLCEIDAHPDINFVVRVELIQTDIPRAIAYHLDHSNGQRGEDEQPDSVPVVVTKNYQ